MVQELFQLLFYLKCTNTSLYILQFRTLEQHGYQGSGLLMPTDLGKDAMVLGTVEGATFMMRNLAAISVQFREFLGMLKK